MSKLSRVIVFGFIAMSLLLSACGTSPTAAPTQAMPAATEAMPAATQSSSVVNTPPPAAGSIAISGAGATFPFPLYSRWFYEYAFVDPSVKFNYQSIGSGGGIKQITAKTVDFGASDAILNEEQFAAAAGIQMFPTVAGARGGLQPQRAEDSRPPHRPEVPLTTVADIFLGKIKNGTTRLAAAQPGRAAARQGHHRRPPLRRLGHDLHLHRLPLQGQPRVEDQRGQCHVGEVAGRPRRQGQRGRVRHGNARTRAPSATSSSPTPSRTSCPTAILRTSRDSTGSRGPRRSRSAAMADFGTDLATSWRSRS